MTPDISDRQYRQLAVLVIAAAAAMRLAWGLCVPVVPISDAKAYEILARMIAEHGVYGWASDHPSAYWPVGTSAIYAALFSAFGSGYPAIVALNITLSSAIVGLAIWLGEKFFNRTIGILAGGLMAVWPGEVTFVTILASELPFTFLLLLGLALSVSRRIPSWLAAIASGAAFGGASYFRPVAVLMPVIVWLSAVPNWLKPRNHVILLLAMLATAATIAPWSIRNTKLFGHFVMISTNGGTNLWIGNNPNSTGYFMDLPDTGPGLNEYERDQVLGKTAKSYILAHPILSLARSVKKIALFYIRETIAISWNADGIIQSLGEKWIFPLKLISQGYWMCMLLLAVTGLVVLIMEQGALHTLTNPIVLTTAYLTAIHAVFFADDRYHFPAHAFLALFAAHSVQFASKYLLSAKS